MSKQPARNEDVATSIVAFRNNYSRVLFLGGCPLFIYPAVVRDEREKALFHVGCHMSHDDIYHSLLVSQNMSNLTMIKHGSAHSSWSAARFEIIHGQGVLSARVASALHYHRSVRVDQLPYDVRLMTDHLLCVMNTPFCAAL